MADRFPLRDTKEGDVISADLLTRLARTAIQHITIQGGTVKRSGTSVNLIPGKAAGGGAGGTTLRFAKISGRAGTDAPWMYTGVEVEHDGGDDFDPGDFTTKSGGITFDYNLINMEEVGSSGVNPIEDDSVVAFWSIGNGNYAFSASNYKGTY